MKVKITVDDRGIQNTFRRAKITSTNLLEIEGSGARVIINKQREDVPFDTSATKLSINSHITESTSTKVVDEIGPETNYGLYLEYGTGEYAEGGKGRKGGWFYVDSKGVGHFTRGMRPRPYVRPSVFGNERSILNAITQSFIMFLSKLWLP
jgi:hypothetical protein